LWQIFTATKHFFLNKMATYRQNNIFDFLGDTEGDPEVVTKEASKKQEPVKAASQTKAPPGKKQDSPPKPSDKTSLKLKIKTSLRLKIKNQTTSPIKPSKEAINRDHHVVIIPQPTRAKVVIILNH